MKILFVIGGLGHGGAEAVVANLTGQLARRGHSISLVSHLRKQFYQISEDVNLIDVRLWQYDTYVGSLPVRIFKKAMNRFLDFVNFRRIIKKEKPELVISFLAAWPLTLLLLCKGRIPLIFAERNAMEYPHGRWNFVHKQIFYRMAYGIQVMSRYDKAYLRNRYKRVFPMPNPLRFIPLTDNKYDELFKHRRDILACGRVHPQKGYEKLILAFSKISSLFPEWSVDICGLIEDETYYRSLVALIEKVGLSGRVTFLGGRKDVDSLMQNHAVFCLSSLHEGFPNVLSESMANGMACVSFDIVTGPSEIIMDGLDGIIVEDQNVEALSEGLFRVLENDELRYTLGLHAIHDIVRFDRDAVVSKWEQLFANTIDSYYGGR